MYSRKRFLEEVPTEMTMIWQCSSDGCKGWMRDNFSFDVQPVCPQCQSEMISGERMLPILNNSNQDQKYLKKGVQI